MNGLMMRNRGKSCRTLRSELDRLFDTFPGFRTEETSNTAVWTPDVDVSEDKDNFFVRAELPGISKDEIELEVENNVLSIRGERRFEKQDEGENYHFVERSYGSFFRSFSLPKNVDSDGIVAEHKDGVLSVMIPKLEEVKPRRVEIRL